MMNICCNYLKSIGLRLNCQKSYCLRIGPRHATLCEPFTTKFGAIPCVKEAKYLGITIKSQNFKVSFTDTKCKFYSVFNNFYSKLKCALDLNVITHLLKSMAPPILTYSLKALNLNKSCLNSLEFCLNRIMYKIYKVNNCVNRQYCMNIPGKTEIYNRQISNFKVKVKLSSNPILRNLTDL